jgi:hypothetical protein
MEDEESNRPDWDSIAGGVARGFGREILGGILGAVCCAVAGWLGIGRPTPILAAAGAGFLLVAVLVWVVFTPPKASRNGPSSQPPLP